MFSSHGGWAVAGTSPYDQDTDEAMSNPEAALHAAPLNAEDEVTPAAYDQADHMLVLLPRFTKRQPFVKTLVELNMPTVFTAIAEKYQWEKKVG